MFKIGKKLLKIPIVQGGMGIGISLSGLAGAVAAEGGAGVISAAQIGFQEEDFYENNLEANKRAIHKEMKKARKLAPDGIIGFNLMVAMNHYKEYALEAVKAGADFIVSGAGLPVELPAYVEGSQVALAPIVSTEKAARVILRCWERKYKKTADFVVIEGPKAGGHLGFSPEQLDQYLEKSQGEKKYQEEVRKIISVIQKYSEKFSRKIPVVLAGGIRTSKDVENALSLGADAVQVGSRFVTTKECDADDAYKNAYIGYNTNDVQIVKSPVGMPGRAIRNSFIEKVEQGVRFPAKKCLGCIHTCNPGKTPYCITDALIHAAKGDLDEALLFCGAHACESNKLETVKEVVDSLLPGRL